MSTAALVARILLGMIFFVFGLNGAWSYRKSFQGVLERGAKPS